MTVLVTGGVGFIGSHLSEALLQEGRDVIAIDTLDPYYDVSLKKQNERLCQQAGPGEFNFIQGSINDSDLVGDVIANNDIEVVYHQAAKAGVRPSVEQPVAYEQNNVMGILTLLEAAEKYGVNRLIHASSSSVYGIPEYLPYDEEHPNNPKSPYGVTKLASEHYCNVYDQLHDISTVNLRYFTVYGPRMRPNMAISNFVSRCLNNQPPIIYGDGKQTRDFTYIDDIVEANLALLNSDAGDGETMNVGSSDNISIRQLAEYVVEETGVDVEIEHKKEKDADSRHTHADISKANDLIDYEPSYDIREGVNEFINWYKQNREWYEPLILNT
ncbi:UDP-glucose 4-epimerase [Haloferax sp. Atlit-4N]|uniref:GDP-mannose 4,6-dehydratase n=1 Tax=Haloferax sp. Atlit-4N TaxID=2077206 RepID=UPI000E278E95|nr:GDP-mannose 4,6-dehydratase [Haloferax sp. Atlit-4N]RDZ52719.1 UDP-glucose 4-epimerase [Haloferax sp. Atlit-4N]